MMMDQVFEFFVIFIFGLSIGSFLNVLVKYLHDSSSRLCRFSVCDYCGRRLSWCELIPLLSFLFLRGRSRCCTTRIDFSYFIIELLSGIGFVLSYQVLFIYGWIDVFIVWLLFSLLFLIAIYDYRYFLIDDRVVFFAIFISILYTICVHPLGSISYIVKNMIIYGLLWVVFFCVQIILTKGKGVGGGDVRLGLLTGVLLGLNSWYAMGIAYFVASIFAGILLMTKRATMKTRLPLAPFIISGVMITLLYHELFNSYVSWIL